MTQQFQNPLRDTFRATSPSKTEPEPGILRENVKTNNSLGLQAQHRDIDRIRNTLGIQQETEAFREKVQLRPSGDTVEARKPQRNRVRNHQRQKANSSQRHYQH